MKRHTSNNPTRDFYNRISRAYDLIADASEHAAREAGEKALAVNAGDTVLEIGCGTGHSLVNFARTVGSTGSVMGVDISEGMLELARRRVADADLSSRVTFELADARSLPIDDETLDIAFMSFTLELFDKDDIPRILDEVYRVLRPNGRLGVVSLAKSKHPGILTDIFAWLHRHFPHFVDCQPIDAAELIQRAGFSIERTINMDIWTLPVVAVIATKEDH